MKKKIAFLSPIGEGGPKTLYKDLVKLLNEVYPEYEYFLVSSVKEWLMLHVWNHKYDVIISSVPFFWKPPGCNYIIQQHSLYRTDRGFTSIPKLLNWLYPYNTYFSKIVLYPSEFLKKYYNSKHSNQEVIYNFSNFPILKSNKKGLECKDQINLITITGFSFYNKARGVLDIFKKMESIQTNKIINFYICGDGKYLNTIKKQITVYKIPKNIKIIFLGQLNKESLTDRLNKSDIFLYSTFQETFGISIIEAMSFGIPVILNNYELFNELYDNEFISKDTIDFRDKLDKLVNDAEYYKNYLEKGYVNLEKFDKEKIIERWHNLIREN